MQLAFEAERGILTQLLTEVVYTVNVAWIEMREYPLIADDTEYL